MWLRPVLPLVALVVGCGSADAPSDDGKLFSVASEPVAAPRRGANTFRIRVATLGGQPVLGAKVEVLATMPAHAHEAPVPHVTDEGHGLYVVEDVIFSMPGLWQIRVVARTAQGSDGKTFQYEVP